MLHGECDVPEHASCGWMPYQKSQAAKTEVADKGIVLEPKYREPTQREQLEYALVSGAASRIASHVHEAPFPTDRRFYPLCRFASQSL